MYGTVLSTDLQLSVQLVTNRYAGASAAQDSFGKHTYLSECKALGLTPAAQIVKYLDSRGLYLTHYGLGDKGCLALIAALKV